MLCASIITFVYAIDTPSFSAFNPTTSSIVAHWDAVPDASYYNVSTTASEQIVKTTDSHTTITGLTPSTAYIFQIEAVDGTGTSSGFSAPTTTYTHPNIPSMSEFSNITTTSIQVNWGSIAEAVYYTVSSTVGTVTTTATTSIFSGLTPNTSYSFQVSTHDVNGIDSAFGTLSTTSTQTLPLLAPPAISNFTNTTSSIQVFWDPISGASYYIISRSTSQAVTSNSSTIGLNNSADYLLPWNRFYNYSASEMLYLKDEIAAGAGPIDSVWFYKDSGNTTTTVNDVTIYLKHTSGTTLSSGVASTAGYTQVYSGSFPNNVSSGWVGVSTTVFDYNGTDNLQMLIVKGNELFTPTRPYYRYTTTSVYRARYYYNDASAFSSGVTSLTQTLNRPNTKFGLTITNLTGTIQTVTTTDTNFIFSNLSPSTTYYFQVRTVDAINQSGVSSSVSSTVTQTPPPPATPDISSFSNVTTTIGVTWGSVYGAIYYTVSSSAGTVTTTNTTYNFTNLPPNVQYTFQVKAHDAYNQSSSFSEATSTITVIPAPDTPEISSFVNTTTSVQINWAAVSGTFYYTVSSTAGTVTTTQTNYTFAGLSPSTTYSFQLRASDVYGQSSNFSSVSSTITDTPPVPSTPTLTSVTKATSTASVGWGVVTYAAYYTVSSTAGTVTTTQTSRSFTGLTPSTDYTFQVNAVDMFGRASSFSDTTSTVTDSVDPPATPAFNSIYKTYSSIELYWNIVSGALFYTVSSTAGTVTTTLNTYTFINLSPSTTYYFQIKAENPYGQESAYSTVTSTLTGRAPSFVSTLANTQTSTTFVYTGGQQTYTVPSILTSITVDAYGAEGAAGGLVASNNATTITAGGLGARVVSTLDVTPLSTVYVYVGGAGSGTTGGYNGGGSAGPIESNGGQGGGGGGASDVRYGGTALGNRAVVAGGGGGGGGGGQNDGSGGALTRGGDGGNGDQTGVAGDNGDAFASGGGGGAGTGGTGSAGGTGGTGGVSGSNGSSGTGGAGGDGTSAFAKGGGGGGGYFGGGGGGTGLSFGGGDDGGGGGGGGGSSYSISSAEYTGGARSGNGQITISGGVNSGSPAFTAITSTNLSGYVTFVANVDDADDDPLMITYRYSAGACGAYSSSFATTTLIGTPSSTYGQGSIVLNNSTSTGYQLSNITTASGVNTVTTTWDSRSQLPLVENSVYCIYAIVSDGVATSTVATSTVTINNLGRPTASSLAATAQTNGTGNVTIRATFDDVNDNLLSLTYRYSSGSCVAYTGSQATTTLIGTPSSTYGQSSIVLNNSTTTGYQLGLVTTTPGANTVTTTWDTRTQLPSASGTYCVYVIAYDGTSTSTVATTTVTLDNVAPSQPSISSFSDTATTITVNWGAVSGASFYTVSSTAGASVTTTLTSRTFSNLTPTTTYSFQIQATDSYSNTSTYSTVSSTRTDSIYTPTITSFSSITTSSITVNWSAVSGTSYYTVSSTAGTVTTTLTSRTFSSLSIFTSYNFQISATDVNGLSSTSSAVTSTRTLAPDPLDATTINNLSDVSTSTIQVYWDSVVGASYYILSRSTSVTSTIGSAVSSTIGTAVTENFLIPFDPYYNYSASEMLYLNSELGAGSKSITAIAFYVGSQSVPLVSMPSVNFYMKHSTSTSLSTGVAATTGYTLVYSGAFPNTGTGWMNVNLDTDFAYDGTSNLQILAVQNFLTTNNGYPNYRYTSASPNRARYYNSATTAWTSGVSTLTASNFLPNIQIASSTASVTTLSGTITSVTTTQAGYLLTSLTPSTTYYFQVIAVDQYDQRSASSTVTSTYTLTPPPPVTPTIVSSTNNTSSIQISWGAIFGVSYYTVSSTAGATVTTTQTSRTFTGLTPSTTYYFQIKANDAYNQSSSFSNVLTTSTILSSIVNAPILSAFTNITSNTIRVNWGSVLWNSYYTVSSTAGTVTTTNTNYTFSGLTPSTTHNFQVKSTDIWGRDTVYSSVGTTSTPKPTAPSTPSINSLDESTLDTNSTIQVFWDVISGASYYTLYYSTTVTGTNSNVAGYGYVGTGTSAPAYYSGNNTPLDRYYNFSSAEMLYLPQELGNRSFTISSLGFYKDSGATGSITGVTIYLKHTSETTTPTATTSLTGYTQVYSGSITNSTASGWQSVNLSPTFAYNGTSSLQILVTKNNQAYISSGPVYRYTSATPNRARSNANDLYTWSVTTTLTASAELPNISFNGGTTTTLDSTSLINQLSGTITTVTTTQTSTIITGLSPSTTYYFQLKAMDSYAQSSASSTVTSTITPPSPSPSSTTISSFSRTTSTITVNWAAASGAGYYTVSSTAGATVTTTQTLRTFTGLTPNTSYTFQVQPANSYGVTTTYSPASSTLTLALPPSITSFAWPTTSSIRVTWSAVTGTTYYTVSSTAGTVTTTQTSYTYTGLTPNTTYTFQAMSDLTAFSDASSTYILLGTFLSSIEDIGYAATFGTVNWNDTVPTGASVTMEVRAGNQSNLSDGVWTLVSKGDALNTNFDGRRYYQYRATLFTSSTDNVPSVDDVSISYYGPSTGSFISSPFDSGSALNFFAGVSWTATTPSSTTFKIQVRTSPDNADWTAWVGPDGTNGTYFTDGTGGEAIPAALADGANDRWIQYRAFFEGNGIVTPTLSDISLTYTVNATPDIVVSTSTVAQASDGTVTVPYDVRDLDTSTGATPGVVSVDLQYCTANCSSPGSETWTTAASSSLSGDFGAGIVVDSVSSTTYTSYTLVWTPALSYDNQYNNTNFKIRLRANDGEAANNIGIGESNVFTLDTTDPVVTSFVTDARTNATNSLTIEVSDDTMTGLEMKLSSVSDLSNDGVNVNSGEWIPYTVTSSWNFIGSPAKVYYQIRDAYGNISSNGDIILIQTLYAPPHFVYQDVSNADSEDWREFLAWEVIPAPTNGFNNYTIYRSTDGENYSVLTTETNRTLNYYLDQSLDTETTYYYKITVEDDEGNVSNYSSILSDKPDGQGGSDATAPTISNVATSDIGTQSVTITWDTDELSNSYIDYITVPGGDFSEAPSVGTISLADTEAGIGQHQVILTGLTPNTDYYFQVRSVDTSNNVGTSTPSPDGHSFTTLSGPSITDIGVSNISNTQVTVVWTTDEASDSYVHYSRDNTFTSSTVVGNADSVNDHSVALTSLTAGTTYYYYVQSGVAEDKNVVDGEIMYHTFTTLNDQTAPAITFDQETDVEVSDAAMIVSWITNEPATTVLEYGTSTAYGTLISNDDLNTSHNFTISGLTLDTLYYVRFTNTDLNNNTSNPIEFSTTTSDSTDYTPPVITSVTTTVVTDDQALITWTTDEGSTSQVYYGTSSTTPPDLYSTTNSNYDRTHAVVLSSLATSTVYYYYVMSVDLSGNIATSTPIESFETLETLSEESEVLLREQAAAAAANTGSSSGSGSSSGVARDSTAPTIFNAQVAEVNGTGAKISWSTDEGADSVVEFGTTLSYGKAGVNLDRTIAHEIVLSDLLPLTFYSYRISSADAYGNRSLFTTGSFTTTLSDAPITPTTSTEDIIEPDAAEEMFLISMKRAAELIKSLSTQVSVEVLESSLLDQASIIQQLSDLLPRPVIGGQPVVDESANNATISWTTDKESNSLIEFVPESVFNETGVYTQTIGDSIVYTNDHSVEIQGLKPATTYRYRVVSRTPTGAESKSKDFSFTTKAQSIEITSYKITITSPEEALFTWSTSLPTDSSISFAPYRNGTPSIEARQVVRDPSIVTEHSMTLTGLEGGVVYDIELSGKDSSGNTVSKLIQGFLTDDTDASPIISQIKTDSSIIPGAKDRIQVIISWVTNELATSQVFYRSGFGSEGAEFEQSTTIDTNYTKKHIVVVTNFEPGSVYQFVVESKDSSGNVGRSKTLTVLTPQKEESVFQVIMGNFEDLFGWVGKLRR